MRPATSVHEANNHSVRNANNVIIITLRIFY